MSTFDPRNGRRAAVYAAQHPTPDDAEPVGAGVSRPERQPCGYGVPRAQCRIGCGYICRRGEDGDKIR